MTLSKSNQTCKWRKWACDDTSLFCKGCEIPHAQMFRHMTLNW